MSKKEVEDSQSHFTVAKPKLEVRGKSTFLDGINASKTTKTKVKTKQFYFKEKGKSTDDKVGAFALREDHSDGTKSYFIKVCTVGAANGRMLNPHGMYFKPGDEVRFEKTYGRHMYEFKKVNSVCFDLYIKFLETTNDNYIRQAEREMING